MSQAVITKAFTEWKARQGADNQPVVLDEFIFANVPSLDVSKPIENTEGVPGEDEIVYRQAVGKAGTVNNNAVVYSITLGADVGDFAFNWIGLANKATGTLAMIIHAPTQQKVKNDSGQQGNVLVRSMLMEYSGAQAATNITTPAETWQIDFTARLAGMDEADRLANQDIYGAAAFFDAGFLVAKAGQQYFVTQGVGYIGGLRTALASNENITLGVKPTKVWADVCYHGTLTSEYQTAIKFTIAPALENYTANGVAHYVFALASIDAAGTITDLRPKGSGQYLLKDKNLAEIASPAAALENLNGVPKTRTVNKKPLTGDIELSPDDVGALPAKGTAAAATKLATPRKIAGVEFDGTKDISVSASDVGAFPITGGTVQGPVKAQRLAATAGAAPDKDIAGVYIGFDDATGESSFINNRGAGVAGSAGFVFRSALSPSGTWTGTTTITNSGDINTSGRLFENGQRVYGPPNPPPYPVTSVNGRSGDVRTCLGSMGITGWFKDELTGCIDQWGTWRRDPNNNLTAVAFPVAFASGAFNVQLTLISSGTDGSGANIGVLDGTMGSTGFVIYARAGENGGFWRAVGK